jgi:TRAP-type mannitol/chloroaromatic compound transport system permease small subunit
MHRLIRMADGIDRVNAAIGRAAAWCVLAMVVVQFLVVLLRYVFSIGSVWLTESILYAHGTLFLLTAAWTLAAGGHVRVDIFYAGASPRRKAWIDLLGAVVLLLPFMLAVLVLSLPYVGRAWATLERSREASGLPLVFILKTLIPIFAILLAAQGIAQAIRAWLTLFPSSLPGVTGRSSKFLDAPPSPGMTSG